LACLAAATSRRRRRGRHAETPWQIPWRGWKDILWRTYQQIVEDRLLAVAAGVVFYGLLAVFPAVTALVSLYGLFASPAAIGNHLSLAAGILPQGAVDILREQIGHLASGSGAKLGFGFRYRACCRAVERECRDEGNHGRAQCRL
jgi:membrane protein